MTVLSSMRGRVSVVAAVGTFLALSLAAIALHIVLARSLLTQIDDVLVNRAFDVAAGIDANEDFLDATAFPDDGVTFIGIIEPPSDDGFEPVLAVHNDDEPDALEVYDIVSPLSFAFAEPVDVSLPSLDWIDGDMNMRLVAVPVETGDEIVVVARSLDGIDQTVDQVDAFSLVSVPLLAMAMAVLVWLLSGRALGPVEIMRRQVESISRTVDLEQRLDAAGQTNELERLGDTMNGLLARLADAQRRERRFASDAAHELRSPLASMAAQLDVDVAHPETADHRRTAELLRRETGRLQQLVDDLLLLARTGAEGAGEHRLLDLDDIIAVAARSVMPTSEVTLQLPPLTAIQVRGDRLELERLVTNVVANGIRHAATRVEISASDDGGAVVITVDDDGVGIPPAERDRVFERFTRLDEARSRDRGGSGLGLAIAREIALRHHGALVVDDGHLGGARFTLRLPAS